MMQSRILCPLLVSVLTSVMGHAFVTRVKCHMITAFSYYSGLFLYIKLFLKKCTVPVCLGLKREASFLWLDFSRAISPLNIFFS